MATHRRSETAPLSEPALVRAALQFANSAGGAPLGKAAAALGVTVVDSAVVQAFRGSLELIAAGAELVNRQQVRRNAQRMLLQPVITGNADTDHVEHRYMPHDLSAILDYVVLLLTDSAKPYGREFCQCQLARCGRFFFAKRPRTGRTRRRYCSTAHMRLAHEKTAQERVKASRAGMPVAEWRRRSK